MKFFMLTPREAIFNSLRRYMKNIHHLRLCPINIYPINDEEQSFFISEFNRIVKELEKKTDKIRNTVVFIDPDIFSINGNPTFSSLDELNPLSNSTDIQRLLSLLILALPEVHWIFLQDVKKKDKNEFKLIKDFFIVKIDKLHEFINATIDFTNTGLLPIFDPGNLRNILRSNFIETEKGVPTRKSCAAAIDEEISYAVMNAYTAYRFGYRVWAVNTLAVMNHIFKNNDSVLKLDCDIKLVFEDLYLNFPDKSKSEHYSHLEKERDPKFTKLKKVEDRILVTVGHKKHVAVINKWQENVSYLKYSIQGKAKILFKPLSGIFDLWKKTGKWNHYKNTPKLQEDFVWPPKKILSTSDEKQTHSAPGRLLLVADRLIERSERILNSAMSVEDAIQAAMLALEAKELLGCKTPTTALEALSLQHQAEVEAECMFYGVEYDFDVNSRIKDIKGEIKAISSWFHQSAKKRSQLNAEISILSMLEQRYRKFGQFDEENFCTNEIRKLHTKLWVSRNPIRWILWPMRAYINILLKSLSRFVIIILLWILFFGVVYWAAGKGGLSFGNSLFLSAETFLAFQPPDTRFWLLNPNQDIPIDNWLFIIPAVLGFIHLGVLISHLYIHC